MPRRNDISSILVIGSGPIVIGQACEFDYSGTQACRVLREEGFRVILVNSNPATIMTDPELADATYVEPITPEFVEKVIAKERPDALLATMGGQTALNTAVALHEAGVLERYGVELIGANVDAIQRGENRELFKQIVLSLTELEGGIPEVAKSVICHTLDEVVAAAEQLGYPVVVRPSYTMGGVGSGFAHDETELRRIAAAGLDASPVTEVLIEESILGWKEYELEVMRDRADNVVIVCSIENLDPMGVHTGDSITVAPAMTLTDREYQRMRDVGIGVIRAVGVDTGGCNIQFAVNPVDGRMIVIEMNPRVSRSSALASKATGFPIAKIAAKVAVGYTLDEITNDITSHGGTPPVGPPGSIGFAPLAPSDPAERERSSHGGTPPVDPAERERSSHGGTPPVGPPGSIGLAPDATDRLEREPSVAQPGGGDGTTPQTYSAAFEPTLDYVVVKVPRFAFEKFPTAEDTLTTHMKSVGEAMAIGRNFTEALGKALRSLEDPRAPFVLDGDVTEPVTELLDRMSRPHDGRLGLVVRGLRAGATPQQVYEATRIDPWFIDQLTIITDLARELDQARELSADLLRQAKRHGLSDAQIGRIRHLPAELVRQLRHSLGIRPVYKTVDTCAAEFAATTPYHYSSYDEETEVVPRTKAAVLILGSGPNRIGQGIEFDYSCVHAAMALSQAGYETVMVNCNPETVSTDYDTSDRLYFEPLTLEDVLEVYDAECAAGPVAGVIVQLGGQTPLKLAMGLKEAGLPIVGTSPEAIDLAEERGAFGAVLAAAQLPAPRFGMATSRDDARRIAAELGYPVLVRPSYVLGGRGMEIVYDDAALDDYLGRVTAAAGGGVVGPSASNPVMVDKFLDDAVEIDVDALYDGTELYLGGVMEHIEEAGVHSGDSACTLPPITLGDDVIERIRRSTLAIAQGVGVRGLINIQYAMAQDTLYVLEANPRASRTVPFVSKATGTQLAKAAALVMLGATIAELRRTGRLRPTGDGADVPQGAPIAVKEAVMPFNRFRTPEGSSVDTVLGPEMRSTGEVMGLDATFGTAFAKSQTGSYGSLPTSGTAFVSVADADKRTIIFPVKMLAAMGFEILATAGTAQVLSRNGLEVTRVRKSTEGVGPNGEPTIVDLILDGTVDLVFNTPRGRSLGSATRRDGYEIRTAAVLRDIPCITTVQGLAAAVQGIESAQRGDVAVRSLQEWARLLDQPNP